MECPVEGSRPCPVWLQVVATFLLLVDSTLSGLLSALGIHDWAAVKNEINPVLRSLWEKRGPDGEWELWARSLWVVYWAFWIGVVWLSPPSWRKSVCILLIIVSVLGAGSIAFR